MFYKIYQSSILVAILAVAGNASAEILGSPHDLQGTNSGDGGQTCIYCHTPHNASNFAPLWSRQTPTGPYTMYASPTLDMTIAGLPQDTSLACLSCHDGTLALDAVVGLTSGNEFISGGNNLGTDLSNDHPISITYDSTADTAFNAATAGKVGGLQLFGSGANQVECATCHSVHDEGAAGASALLWIDNAGSALCTACHIK